ncbi:MAG: hypothetical protein CXZ00_09165 [Acidobacteria bacterium]|nr:MAG: hypothetical protein CXZ00_09165 [Acidobacteriota bacterium]
MKSSKLILALWLGASAWAQTQALAPQAKPPASVKPAASSSASPKKSAASFKSPATSPLPQKAKVQAINASTKLAAPIKPPAHKPSKDATPLKKKSTRSAAQSSGKRPGSTSVLRTTMVADKKPVKKLRRDPFVSPIVERPRTVACLGPGKRCLVVSEIHLHGVVHSANGYIAVVMNGDRTYFLRVRDPLADGEVERITKDALVLRERSYDALGRPLTREVIKKIGAPAV